MNPDRTVSCGHDIEWLLHRRADDRLTPEEAALLERRVATCAACHERAALLAWVVDALGVGRRAVPSGLTEGVMRRVSGSAAPRARRALPLPLAPRWLVAAAAVLAAAGGVAVLRRDAAPTPAAPVAAAPTVAAAPGVEVELQLAEPARSVNVAGDFNAWEAASMRRDVDGVFRIRLSLAPGRYQYAFLVDERRWTADPRAATTVDSGFGGNDSVLDLTL